MTAPAFQTTSGPFTAASNADLPVVLPTVTVGWLMLLVVNDFAVGQPSAPSGWTKVSTSDGISVFSKIAVSGDSGATVTVAAFSTQTGISQNTAYVLAFSNAVAVDKTSSTAGGSGPIAHPPGVVATSGIAAAVLNLYAGAHAFTGSYTSGLETQRFRSAPSGAIDVACTEIDMPTGGSTVIFGSGAAMGTTAKYRAMSLSIVANRAPTAPILLTPANTADLDQTVDQTFTWTFNDPDPGDSQSAYDFGLTDVTASGSEAVTNVTSAAPSRTITGGTLTPGHTYSWRVRTYDASGAVGPYSAAQTFVAAPSSAGPTFTSPTTGSTVTTPTITATLTGVGFGLRWRRVADSSGSPNPSVIYADSGPLPAASSFSVTFDTNGRDEHLQASSENSFGVWSPYADVLVHVAFTAPPAPTVTPTADQVNAAIDLAWTTPAPGGGQPAALYADLYVSSDGGVSSVRVATGLPASGSWTFWTPASGVDYQFQAVTVASDGAAGYSGWTAPGSLIDAGASASSITRIDDPGVLSTIRTPVITDGGAP